MSLPQIGKLKAQDVNDGGSTTERNSDISLPITKKK